MDGTGTGGHPSTSQQNLSEHELAVQAAAEATRVPSVLLFEAIAEAQAVSRHRARALPARRINDLVTALSTVLDQRPAQSGPNVPS